MRKIVVIGAGAAGMAAATRARRFDSQAQITVLEGSGEYSRGTCSLPYYIAGEIDSARSLVGISPQTLAEMRIDLRLGSRVTSIEPAARRVHLGHQSIDFDRLIVSTGSRSRTVPLISQGTDWPRLWTLRSQAEAEVIKTALDRFRPHSVAVVGGGYLGLEMAEVLTQRGCRVTVFHRQATLMRLLPAAHQAIFSLLLERGVTVRLESEVKLIDPSSRRATVEFQDLSSGQRRSEGFDAIFLAPGVVPEAELLSRAGARLGPSGGVVIDSRGQTSLSGIYAAGDGVELPNPYGGKTRYVPLATTAARWGRVCGENAVGGSLRGPAPWGGLAVRLFDSQVASVGHPEDWSRAEEISVELGGNSPFPARGRSVALFLSEARGGRLLGAQFVGPQAAAWADLASLALQKDMTVSDFSELDLNYTPPLSHLWHPFLLAARLAEKFGRREVRR